jgi:catechol 2,3-dioxygenase-like lactoylglutathione lyase family enzyme
MQSVIPALRINEYDEAKEFYVGRLGFVIDWEHRFESDYPVFMQVSKENVSFYLTEHAGDCEMGGLTYLYVADVDSWYDLCLAHGIVPNHQPEDKPWGNREMRIYDPDGNRLCFATRLNAAVAH